MVRFEDIRLKEPLVVDGRVITTYRGHLGACLTRFFTGLKDRKILGIRCPICQKVYMPPRSTCGKCFSALSEWVELKDVGTIESYTIVHKQLSIYPRKVPFVYALIKLDGADTSFVHFIDRVKPEDVKVGMRVKAVFRHERSGDITDIDCFEPL